MRLPMCKITHFLLVIENDVMRLPFTTMHNITHFLLAMMRLPLTKMYNTTHSLLAIGKNVMRQPFTIMCNVTGSLAVGHRKRCDETAFHKDVQCHSPTVTVIGDETAFHKKVQYHSQSVGHEK